MLEKLFALLGYVKKPAEEPPRVEVPPYIYEGVRVRANNKSGFHKGATGVVKFVQPRGNRSDKVWVWRDGAGSACYFWPWELELDS